MKRTGVECNNKGQAAQ